MVLCGCNENLFYGIMLMYSEPILWYYVDVLRTYFIVLCGCNENLF
jgi:hypothetical protein